MSRSIQVRRAVRVMAAGLGVAALAATAVSGQTPASGPTAAPGQTTVSQQTVRLGQTAALEPTVRSGEAAAGTAAATAAGPAQVAESFYAVLLQAMKEGPQLGFEGRRKLLDPEIRRDFDLPLMTRLVVGPPWHAIAPAKQAELVEAFSAFSVANYASEFTDFSGERFVVNPGATMRPNGDAIVHTRLLPVNGRPVEFDYLMRRDQGRWRILDVYLTGAISQLAARRSEFTAVLREGGADALIALLRQKTTALAK